MVFKEMDGIRFNVGAHSYAATILQQYNQCK
jgi:hypothetical protein